MQNFVYFLVWLGMVLSFLIFFPLAFVLAYGLWKGWFTLEPEGHVWGPVTEWYEDGVPFHRIICQNCGMLVEHNVRRNTHRYWNSEGKELFDEEGANLAECPKE